jgi:flagellar motor switch protein FliM
LGRTILNFHQILELEKDDLILFNKKSDNPFELYANNAYKFDVSIGRLNFKKAAKVVKMIPAKYDIKVKMEEENG